MTVTSKEIIRLMGEPGYRPLKNDELMAAAGVPKKQHKQFSELVQKLLDSGQVVRLKRKGLALSDSADLATGKISFIRSGNAFVHDALSNRDIFISSKDTHTALPDDRVLVRIKSKRHPISRYRSPEGKVIRVIERAQSTIVGTLRKQRKIYFVEPLRATISTDVVVPRRKNAEVGDRVLVKLTAWEDPRMNPEGEIVEVIGPEDQANLDTNSIIMTYELSDTFPRRAVREAEKAEIKDEDLWSRLDLRQDFVLTIDPETARDYDDAISLKKSSAQYWELGIHIADVSRFVQRDSAVDQEARRRGTSVYFPDKTLPMLPEQLSNGLCSLQENQDRLTFSVLVTLDRNATVIATEFRETIIRSRIRLTYAQALAAIADPAGETGLSRDVVSKLRQIHRLTKKLRQNRFENGALAMSIPEVKINVDDEGFIADIGPVASDEAHELIEECMLLANECVCRQLAVANVPLIHRVHDQPDPEKLSEVEELFYTAGIEIHDLSKRDNLCKLLLEIADTPQSHAWNIAILRAMKKAEYSTNSIGHYGLAKQYYTHFTSPIRRYPDLIVHRILKSYLHGQSFPYTSDELVELADHCSARERVADEAERDLVELKVFRYFSDQLNRGAPDQQSAVVIDVRNFGVFIDLPKFQVTGLIHVSMLTDDFYDFNPVCKELRGRQTGNIFRVGMMLNVVIAKVNLERRFLDFVLVFDGSRELKKSSRKRKKSRA